MARTVTIGLQLEIGRYVQGAAEATRTTKAFVTELNQAAKAGNLDAVANSASRMGLVLGGAFALAVGAAARFDKQMSEVAAVSNATGGELERLRQAAIDAGNDTQFSATEAAKAEAELAKAGLSTSQILGGALRGSLALAAAGSLDLSEAAETAAKTMNMFHLQGKDVGHVADVLAAAANKSATDVHGMGDALKQSGLVASAAGISLEETVGTLSAFADRALQGSDAGTSLKSMLVAIQAPSGRASKLMSELGISAYDANGNFVGLARLAGVLQQSLGGLTQQQRNAALATIFGTDAMRAANVLYSTGEQGIRDYTAAVDDTGAAAETARKKMDNLAGDVEKFTSSLETLAIKSGSGASSGLRVLVQAATALVDQFGKLPSAVGGTAVVLAGLGSAALLLGSGWVRARGAIANVTTELTQMGPQGERAARGLQSVTAWAGRAAAAFAVWQVAMALAASTQDKLNPQIDALGDSLAKWAGGAQLSGEAARVLGADMGDFNARFRELADTSNARRQALVMGMNIFEAVVPGMAGASHSLATLREQVTATDESFAQMVQSGNADIAAAAFNKMFEQNKDAGVDMNEMRAMFPQYAAALQTVGSAASTTGGQIAGMGAASAEAAAETKKLDDAIKNLFDIQMSADEAADAWQQSLVDLKAELADGTRVLSGNTKEARENRAAMRDSIKQVEKNREVNLSNNMTMEQANAVYDQQLTQLRQTALGMGFNRAAVDKMVSAYRNIPKQAGTTVTAPGAVKATGEVRSLRAGLSTLPDLRDTKVSTPGATAAAGQANSLNFAIRRIPDSHGTEINVSAGSAIAQAHDVQQAINAIRGKTVSIYIQRIATGQLPMRWGGIEANRWGGTYQHAADGLLSLRDASVYSPLGSARYAIAEPETQGEAFVPRSGDYGRSTSIIDQAAHWYGGRFVPGGSTGGTVVQHFHASFAAGVVGSRQQLLNWMVDAQRELASKGRI